MKRTFKISPDILQTRELFLRQRSCKFLTPLSNIPAVQEAHWIREFTTQKSDTSFSAYSWPNIAGLFLAKWRKADESIAKKHLIEQVSVLKKELLRDSSDLDRFESVLEGKGAPLFRRHPDGSAIVELLKQLNSSPDFAFQVFNWRREHVDYQAPMTKEEYARGITVAGRLKDADLATETFKEAANKNLKATSTYNALMGAYMFNGLSAKCQSLFRDLKREPMCTPTIVTYNILISMFGRLMLVDHMEATLREIRDLNLSPNVTTYNYLIAGYITAWTWNKMEITYRIMKAEDVKPDLTTHLLMLRGYAHSGKLQNMEEMYGLVKDHVNSKEIPLIRAMICAYCRSSVPNRVERIEEMLKLIPENDYRPWLNVLLIRMYANEGLLEQMENLITEALLHNTSVTTVSIMRSIVTNYFRNGAVDKLANFVKHAESAGWKICRSLYHSKMVMYASERRITEMERVLVEMDRVNMNFSKKTFWILYKAYSQWGEKNKVEQVLGMMCRHGHTIPLDVCCS